MQLSVPQIQNPASLASTFHTRGGLDAKVRRPLGLQPWRGVAIHKHKFLPGQCLPSSTEKHYISLLVGQSARMEYRSSCNQVVTFLKPSGALTISPARISPDVRLHSPVEFVHCALDETFTNGIASEMDPAPTAMPSFQSNLRNASIESIVRLLVEEFETDAPSGEVYVESLAVALATRYLLLDRGTSSPSDYTVSALPARLVAKVRQKIESDLQAELSLKCLAEETGYSREHFLRMFHVATGMTPHQYILELRMGHAKELLRRKRESLIDIAALCGFSSQSHMTTVFRSRLGVTPAQFRRDC